MRQKINQYIKKIKKITLALLLLGAFVLKAQEVNKNKISNEVVRIYDSINKVKQAEKTKIEKELWYNKIGLRGYVQVRYNGLLSSNDKVACE